jgi:hypothetical protein
LNCVVTAPDYENGKQGTLKVMKEMMDANQGGMKAMQGKMDDSLKEVKENIKANEAKVEAIEKK